MFVISHNLFLSLQSKEEYEEDVEEVVYKDSSHFLKVFFNY